MSIRRRLKVSFAAIALAALGIALSNYLQYLRLDGDARAMNLVGSERMRSYRLAMLTAQHVAFPGAATEEAIGAELARFRAVLVALRDGDPRAGLKPAPTPEAVAALESGRELFESYELSVRTIVHDADEWERLHRGGRDPELRAVSDGLAETASALAARMDRATAEFERASADAVRLYRHLQLGLFAATAAVALLAIAVMRRTVLRHLPALEEGLHELARGRLGAEVHLGPVPGEVGRLEEAFNAMSREIERARATIVANEAELARRNEALLRADEMKSQFIANMSHELRTPLTAIIGFADLLRRGHYGSLDARQQERLGVILRNAHHLVALIGDVLDLSKIEAGKLDVHPERFAPGMVLSDVAESLRPLAEAKGLALETSISQGLPAIESDPERVRQILYNLGSNAVKFTAKGAVRLRAAPLEGERAVRVEVEDTGVGIAAGELGHLFRRFEQIDPTATRRHGGAGLGLHISKRIAELIGARIEVESEPGRGSRFALVLPEQWRVAQPRADERAEVRERAGRSDVTVSTAMPV